MTLRLFAAILLIVSAPLYAGAPTPMKAAYEVWQEANPEQAEAQHLYVAASAHRSGSTVIVKLGLAGYQPGFRINVQPSKKLETAAGATTYGRAGEDAFLQLGQEGEALELSFAQPRVVVASADADVVEVTVQAPSTQETSPVRLIIPVTEAESEGPTGQIAVSDGLPKKCPTGCYSATALCSGRCGTIGPKCCDVGGEIVFDCVDCEITCTC